MHIRRQQHPLREQKERPNPVPPTCRPTKRRPARRGGYVEELRRGQHVVRDHGVVPLRPRPRRAAAVPLRMAIDWLQKRKAYGRLPLHQEGLESIYLCMPRLHQVHVNKNNVFQAEERLLGVFPLEQLRQRHVQVVPDIRSLPVDEDARSTQRHEQLVHPSGLVWRSGVCQVDEAASRAASFGKRRVRNFAGLRRLVEAGPGPCGRVIGCIPEGPA
mmetsp:Transcript_27102/g.90024  ORF Transcript_27102/g.90024 Transcript_27102/m.90024 type:complete len:216 (-) Transcript_27102:114-761(-)